MTVNIDVGIVEAVKTIGDKLRQRRQDAEERRDRTLTDLRQQLEIVLVVVFKLEDLFNEILRDYRDDKITQNPEALQVLRDQTDRFLRSRRLLPYLDTAIEAINAAAFSPKFESRDYQEMVRGLRELSEKLNRFRMALGPGGQTAPGLWRLIDLRRLAEQQLATSRPEDPNIALAVDPNIAIIAEQAFNEYDWRLSSDIRGLIGSVIINS